MRANPLAQSALAAVRGLCDVATPGGYREVRHVSVPQAIDAVYPYLHVRGAAAAIEFYIRVFGAREAARITSDDGRIAHAELRFGDALVMLADEHPEFGIASPQSVGGSGVTLHLHVRDLDALTQRAREAGATILREPADQPHGERQSRLRDPFGHEWLLGQEIVAR
jgi:PhnB protein